MFITKVTEELVHNKPLSNLKYVLKDVFVTKNILTTAGSKILYNFIPSYNCTVYELLKENGANLIGKADLDEFSCGSLGINNVYNLPFANPYNIDLYVGGSSSGSAVIVSKNECDFALGTDTGGSIRLPAILCHIYGFKPSYGQISRYGVIPLCNELDTVGILANSFETIKKVYTILNVKDSKDLTQEIKNNKNTSIKIFCLSEDFEKVKKLFPNYKISIYNIDTVYVMKRYYQLMLPFAYSNLNKYDGLKFNNLNYLVQKSEKNIVKDRTELLGGEIKSRIFAGFELTKQYTPLKTDNLEFGIYVNIFEKQEIFEIFGKNEPLNFEKLDKFESKLTYWNLQQGSSIAIPFKNESSILFSTLYGFDLQLLDFVGDFIKE